MIAQIEEKKETMIAQIEEKKESMINQIKIFTVFLFLDD